MKETRVLGQPEIKVLPFNFYLVNATGRSIQVHPGRSYTIGRDPNCDIRIVDTLMSRDHCRLDWRADTQWSLVDNKSVNGTFVNDTQIIGTRRLKDRDRIRFGGQILTLYYVNLDEKADQVASESKSYRNQATLDLSQAFQHKASARSALAGSLRINPLPSLLELFRTNRVSGRVVFDDAEERSLWLLAGKPVHALYDALSGGDAMMQILESASSFCFYHGDIIPNNQGGNLQNHQHAPSDDGEISLGTQSISVDARGTEPLPPVNPQ